MSGPDRDSVGIVSAGMYLPAQILKAEEIANLSGLEEWMILEKIGILEKRMAGPDDHPNQMAVWPLRIIFQNEQSAAVTLTTWR